VIDTPLEQCDDGNGLSNDGCSSVCLPERGAPPETLTAQIIELPFMEQGGHPGDMSDGGPIRAEDGSILAPGAPETPSTGPAALAVMLAGATAGFVYRRRR
jgi:cysteine-rich repeat protein